MENQHAKPTRILSINLTCCQGCSGLLKKKLLKLNGVESVSIGAERDVVIVTGTIDPVALLQKVEKLGKRVVLLYPKIKQRQNIKERHNSTDVEENHNDYHVLNEHRDVRVKDKNQKTQEEGPYQCPNRDDSTMNIPKRNNHRNHCCPKEGLHADLKKQEQEFYQTQKKEEHKCEDYSPMTYDERVCRDFWCTTHPPLRKIIERVPADETNIFGGFPFYGGFGGDPFYNGFGGRDTFYGGFGGGDLYGSSYYYPDKYHKPQFGHY